MRRTRRALAVVVACLFVTSGCEGEATYTCTYAYERPDGGADTGTYASETMTCGEYREMGSQAMAGSYQACEDAGLADGAVEVVCVCRWDDACLGDRND